MKFLIPPIALAVAQLAAFAASAQSSLAAQPSAPASTLQTVVVTAQQREQRQMDVPIFMNTLNADEIGRRGITDLLNLSYAVPGMITVVTGMAQNRVMLRGLGDNGGNFPLVGLYLDEVSVDGPISRPIDIRAMDLARAEVLNGPQGTLYGQGSMGGTVRFLTRNPVLGETSHSAAAGLWGMSSGGTSHRVSATSNLPLGQQAALRIAGTYEKTGGWIDALTANRTDINDGRRYQVRIKGLVNLTPKLSLIAMAQVHRNDVGSLGNGENADGNLLLPAFAPAAVQPAHNEHELYSLTANWDLGGMSLLAVVASSRNASDGGFYSPFAGNGRLIRFDYDDKAHSVELRLTSSAPGSLKWAAGAFYRKVDFNAVTTLYQMGPVNSPTGTNVNFVTSAPIQSDSLSVYANGSFDVTDRLQIGGGLRWFTDDENAPRAGQAGKKFDSIDPRVYASFKLEPRWTVYASAAKGFRSGGFNAVNAAFPETFEPEKVWSYELGTKFEAMGGLLRGEVAAFTSRLTNMQSTTIATSVGLGYTGNVGRADIKGLDWSFRVQPMAGLQLGWSGAVLDTEVVSIAARSAYAQGDRLNYIPKYNHALFAEAEFKVLKDVQGRARVDYSRRGSSTFSQRTANLTASNETISLLNARLALNWSQYGVEVYGENLLNDRGQTYPNPVEFATRAVPRTFGIRGTVSF